jgi:hypothetical protein
MKRTASLLIAFLALALAGCASLETAGHSAYTVKAVVGKDGKVAGYELDARDGKEYSGRNVSFQTNGGAAALMISEGESKAFKGQALAVKALTVLPVTNLSELLK